MVKKYLIFIILFFLLLSVYSQNENNTIVEFGHISSISMPEYKGGVINLMLFIKKNIKYPLSAKKDSIEGIVYLNFMVDTNGNTYDHKIIKGLNKDFNKEALRISKLIKFYKPAIQKGKPIKINYFLPIKFSIPKVEEKKCKEKL